MRRARGAAGEDKLRRKADELTRIDRAQTSECASAQRAGSGAGHGGPRRATSRGDEVPR